MLVLSFNQVKLLRAITMGFSTVRGF